MKILFCATDAGGARNLAPYARPKKNTKLAKIAPAANAIFKFPENCWDMDPIRITVSR